MSIVIKVLVNAVALWVAALVVPGITLGLPGHTESWTTQVGTVVVVAVIFGLVNAIIKPVVKFFAFPFIILTLGLLTLVINAFMLQITSWVAGAFNLAFHVNHFLWDAVFGGIIIAIVSMILHLVLPDRDDRARI
ncbi:MAG TPA: phage holin family protein [Segeticoccus sp.]|uniref:phage holin family protein n=1 Tax=Segeticoccus sp. TaxID=2706531 RepID=UPI002D808A98|nr:phage holin family protein [Segeticoccus sp.]HET8602029.1 phage holin family protein [Segeticoccus sp.]